MGLGSAEIVRRSEITTEIQRRLFSFFSSVAVGLFLERAYCYSTNSTHWVAWVEVCHFD